MGNGPALPVLRSSAREKFLNNRVVLGSATKMRKMRPSSVCDSMTVLDGTVRSHRTAPTHAVTTHPVPITPHHVSNAIATPIGPNSSRPLSNGKNIRAASGRMVPSITTPARTARYIRPRPPPRTRRAGLTARRSRPAPGSHEAENSHRTVVIAAEGDPFTNCDHRQV